jgi:hypothetical protein
MSKTLPPHVHDHPAVRDAYARLNELHARKRALEARSAEIVATLNRAAVPNAPRESDHLRNWLARVERSRVALRADIARKLFDPGEAAALQQRLKDLDAEHAKIETELKQAVAREEAPDPKLAAVHAYIATGKLQDTDLKPLQDEYTALAKEQDVVARAIVVQQQEVDSRADSVFREFCDAKRAEYCSHALALCKAARAAFDANSRLQAALDDLASRGVSTSGHLRNVVWTPAAAAADLARECREAELITDAQFALLTK